MNNFTGRLLRMAIAVSALMPTALPGESRNLAIYEEARALFENIPEQAKIERRICEEELQRGSQLKRWSEEDRNTCLAWLDHSFTDPWTDKTAPNYPISLRRVVSPWADFMNRLTESRGAVVLQNEPCQWFYTRITGLNEVRNAAARQMRVSGLSYCEEVWMEARSRDDLGPAIRILNEIRQIHPVLWAKVRSYRQHPNSPSDSKFRYPFQIFSDPEMLEAFDFWTVIGTEKPLFIPDAQKDLQGYWDFYSLWNDLRTIRHRFIGRPRIAERFARAHLQYLSAVSAAQERLDSLILANASAAVFEEALLQYAGKAPDPVRRPSRPQNFGMPMGSPIKDIRELVPVRPRSPVEPQRTVGFRYWLAFRQAEERADRERMAESARELGFASRRLSSRVALHVQNRVAPYLPQNGATSARREALEPSATGANPLREMIAFFESKKQKELAEAWSTLLFDVPSVKQPQSHSSQAWTRFAGQPEFKRAFELKEPAVGQVLSAIAGTGATRDADPEPISMMLIDLLERSCAEGDKEKLLRTLQVDAACGDLPLQVRQAYVEIASNLPGSAGAGSTDKSESIAAYQRMLMQTVSPAAARYAAEQIKNLRKP